MRGPSLLIVAIVSACGAPAVQSQRLADGSWSFQCELPMDDCVRQAQEKCPSKRFKILEGVSETRLRDAPPYEQSYHTSRLRLECTTAEPLFSFGGGSKPPAVSPSAPAASAARPPVCSQGQTRECVGPGACKGGQACLVDGTGFSACDCGPLPPPPAAQDAPEPAPSPAPGAPATP